MSKMKDKAIHERNKQSDYERFAQSIKDGPKTFSRRLYLHTNGAGDSDTSVLVSYEGQVDRFVVEICNALGVRVSVQAYMTSAEFFKLHDHMLDIFKKGQAEYDRILALKVAAAREAQDANSSCR